MDEKDFKIWELERDQLLAEKLEEERETSDSRYAMKLTEKAVFAIVGLMGMTIFGVLFKVAIDYIARILK